MYDIYAGHKITGQFGEDRKTHKHKGVDVAYPLNSDLIAMSGGKVGKIGNDPYGYGNYIDIISNDGLVQRYAHANGFDVKSGDVIKEGQKIGRVGSTGRSTGPHVHIEFIQNGRNIDPMDVFKNPNKYLKTVVGIPKKQDITPQALAYAKTLQNQEPNDLPIEDNTRNILTESLQDIPTPQEPATIQDIFNAKSGQRLNAFFDYLNSPQGAELVGALAGAVNPKYEGLNQDLANARYMSIAKEKEDYKKQKSEQTKIAQDLFKEIGVNKRFETEMDYKKARAKVEDAFKNRELTQKDYELSIKELDSKAERELKKSQTEKIKAETTGSTEEQKQMQTIERQLDAFEKTFGGLASSNTPKGMQKGAASIEGIISNGLGFIPGTGGTNEVAAFNAMRAPLVSIVARKIAGEKGNMSDRDIARAEKAVPSVYDSPDQRVSKMKALRQLIKATAGNTEQKNNTTITNVRIIE